MSAGACVVLIAAPAGSPSRKIANALLDARLAACVQILPSVQSHFWWEGKKRSGKESLLLVKTRRSLYRRIEKAVLAIHPYCTPEILQLHVSAGSSNYLAWLIAETEPKRGRKI